MPGYTGERLTGVHGPPVPPATYSDQATLEAQRALASIQEDALRERVRGDAIRAQRALLYKVIIVWLRGFWARWTR